MPTLPPPPRAPLGHCVLDLLAHSRDCLGAAAVAETPADRYASAHLAALRAGAAVLAARSGRSPRSRRNGPRDVWSVLAELAPELGEWAAFFASGAGKRAAAEAGLTRAVTSREADDLLREAEAFLSLVAAVLGLPHQESLTGLPATGLSSAGPSRRAG